MCIHFPETLWILETPIHWKCICFPWNPLEFGYANIRSPYVYIHFPETLWILKTLIHWKPLSIRGPFIPWNFEALGSMEPLKHWALHTSGSLTSALVYVMVGYPKARGRGGGSPLPLANSEALLSLVSFESLRPGWVLAPLNHWSRNCVMLDI